MVFAAFKEFQLMPPSPRPTVKRRRNFNQQRSMRLQLEEKTVLNKKNIKGFGTSFIFQILEEYGQKRQGECEFSYVGCQFCQLRLFDIPFL